MNARIKGVLYPAHQQHYIEIPNFPDIFRRKRPVRCVPMYAPNRLERPNLLLLHLGTNLHLKEEKHEKLDLQQNSSCTQVPGRTPQLVLDPELLPSYLLATVNQRLVWLYQMYFQTICDCSWSCFRTPTCPLTIDIQLDTCQPPHLLPFPERPCPAEGWSLPFPSCCVRVGL